MILQFSVSYINNYFLSKFFFYTPTEMTSFWCSRDLVSWFVI